MVSKGTYDRWVRKESEEKEMSVSNFETFTMQTIQRSELNNAPYNPRKINQENKKKLKKGLKEFGLVQPIVVNKRTMNICGGHQRILILDEMNKYPNKDYALQVAMIEVDDETEVKINIFLNNPASQGEWDEEKLQEIKLSFPEIDFQKDLGFDMLDIQHIFAGSDAFEDIQNIFDPKPEQIDVVDMATEAKNIDKLKAAKKTERDLRKGDTTQGDDYTARTDNYTLTLVFENNAAKEDFCQRARIEKKETHVKATILYDIADGKINLRGIKE